MQRTNSDGSSGGAKRIERRTGFEPVTFCLGSRHSTAELTPLTGHHLVGDCPNNSRELKFANTALSYSGNVNTVSG